MGRFTNPAELKTLQKNVTTSGTPLKLSPHIVAKTISFADADPDTIDDSGNGLVNAGFIAGGYVQVSGSTSNDGIYLVDTVAAGTLTLAEAETLTTEVAGDTVTIIKVESKTDTTELGYPISDGVAVVIKAKSGNTDDITLGGSSTDAANTSALHIRLSPTQSMRLQVANLLAIWIDAATSGDGVEIAYEK